MARRPAVSIALVVAASLFAAGARSLTAPPPRGATAALDLTWVSRTVEAPRVSQRTFRSTAARSDVSYHVYVPAAYDREPTRRFPVVYWLHGSGGGLPGIPQLARRFDAAIEAGQVPPMLVVMVNGLEMGMYVDWRDGSAPVETVLATELVAHLDATYRTIATREGRLLDGFSMGGYGAARFGFKYPERFRAVSIMGAGPMQEALAVTPRVSPVSAAQLLRRVYGGDQAHFLAVSPRRLAEEHAVTLRSGSLIRMVVGDQDETYANNRAFHAHLERLGIPHDWTVLPGVPHNPNGVLDALGDAHWAFYRKAFAAPPSASDPSRAGSLPAVGAAATTAGATALPDSVIKLTFLGTGAPRPSRDRHGPAILVEAGDRRLLIDAGPGVRQRIFEAGGFGLLTGVTDIFATHLHYDHVGGVADLWIPGWMYGRPTPLRVHGPPGTTEFVNGLRQAYRWDVAYRQIVGIAAPGSILEAREIHPGVVFDEGGVK
ncbi:MAG: alpha/beta hydrolase-fold protein, partial [Gemmatimonadota bacterium]